MNKSDVKYTIKLLCFITLGLLTAPIFCAIFLKYVGFIHNLFK